MDTAKGQRGFTLVELAIVLVIIGIILGAVLKGQELINNAKIKRLYNQYREILAAVYTYYDKYGKYPGDDNTANPRWPAATNGNSNGIIDGFTFNCAPSATTETCQTWLHLRLANIISGPTTAADGPRNSANVYGGTIGIGYATVQTLAATFIGFDNVPYDVCQTIDTQYDDGVFNSGSIRGSGDYTTATSGIFDLYFKL
ncbi:prepilin-type N-terminal cleavage/methylation domain-containing protein [Thermodesulfomicrobium sp. WS]|uniref:type II secretion system protein n=1 Tax=Thermodesulfomicrobium sp. WS TaxID=3004129 RepID=UPI0024936253|nr:prepilin-type N-terminal cleavage/methylation domain-containing protein [Thermodesulfomicrobium sp. WS]BDV02080.1 prepilin-type N-terminal cleavage/methylation domain-containing protein [Thermodesulfomicrobium sp. WS]